MKKPNLEDRVGKGFTLIELLVSLGVVGTLIGLASYGISRAVASGRSTKCAANLDQIAVGILSYSNDNKGLPSFNTGNWVNEDYLFTKTMASHLDMAAPYINAEGNYVVTRPSIFLCPADKNENDQNFRPGSYSYFPNRVNSVYYEDGRPIIGDVEPFHWGKQNGVGIYGGAKIYEDTLP